MGSLTIAANGYAELRARLAEAFGLSEDDQAVLDTAEGESDLPELIAKAMREIVRREAQANAMSAIIADNEERRARHQHAARGGRTAIAHALEAAGLRKLEFPDMTISLRMTRPALRIVDESRLPDWAWRVKRELNKAEIIARSDECGDAIQFSNAEPALTVRTK